MLGVQKQKGLERGANRRGFTFLLISMCLISNVVKAQTQEHRWMADLSAIFLDYEGPVNGNYFQPDTFSTGISIGAHAYINSWLNLSFNSAFVPNVDDYPDQESDGGTRETSLIDVNALMQFKSNGTIFSEESFFAPYISTGIGLNSASNISRVYIPAALGIRLKFTPTLYFQIQGTYKVALNEEDFQHASYQAGLVFALPGASKPEDKPEKDKENENSLVDSDGDGVRDVDDECPDEPGLFMNMGCPKLVVDDDTTDSNRIPSDTDPNGSFGDDSYKQQGTISQSEKEWIRNSVNKIFFEFGSNELTEESKYVLDSMAQIMMRVPKYGLKISGHTDNTGSYDDNKVLSIMRAHKVKYYLSRRGISQTRITCDGFGGDFPAADNSTEEGRAKNRRVEFEVLDPGVYIPPKVLNEVMN